MNRFLLLVICLLPLFAGAQKNLPHRMSVEEEKSLPLDLSANRGVATPPPHSNLRTLAEWEEVDGFVVTWTSYKAILADLIDYGRTDANVYVVCNDSVQVKNELLNNYGLGNLNNIYFIQAPYNSVWIRDYGPQIVYGNDVDTLVLVDWIYNRPRPKDDEVPDFIGDFLGLEVYSTTDGPADLVHTGGNFLADGMGTGFSSHLVLNENGPGNGFGVTVKDAEDIDQIMEDYMGITRYIKMETLPYDGIHHIDMHMKLLDEETILFGEYPAGTADGPQIEANIAYVQDNFMSSFGTPYRIVRIPMPPDFGDDYPPFGDYRTYTNSVFANRTIIVPTYEEQYDTTALRIYRENMPGYNVVGIDCNAMIGALGALHCITHEIGTMDPLRIVHQRLDDVVDYTGVFQVNAIIQHRSGIQEAMLHYTTDTTAGYQSVPMTLADAATDTWTANIPGQTEDTEIFYYIESTANSGKSLTRPLSAPQGYWNFTATFTNVATEETFGPASAQLLQAFPNPAGAITCIPVETGQATQAQLDLLDIFGRPVETLFSGQLPAGPSRYFIDANRFAAGTYFIRLQTSSGSQVQKLMIKY